MLVDKEGNSINFLLRVDRDALAAKPFKENVDKSGSNKATLDYLASIQQKNQPQKFTIST